MVPQLPGSTVGVEHRGGIQFLLQGEASAGTLPRCPVWLGRIWACMLASPTQEPVGVEGGTHTCGTHAVFSGHGAGLPFCASRPSFRRQVFRGCFLAISEELILLSPYNAGPVHHFRIPFQVIECTLKGYFTLVCVPRICRRFLKFMYVVVHVCMGKVYSLLVRGVSRSKTLNPLILSQSGWMLYYNNK